MVEVVRKDEIKAKLDEIKQRDTETTEEQRTKNNVVYELSEFLEDSSYEETELLERLEPARMEL